MRQLITHNLGLKVVSFLIAVAIWYRYSLVSPVGISQTFERRLKIVNKDARLAVSHSLEDGQVRITLAGRRLDLMQIDRQLEAHVDLKNVRSAIGEVSLPVEVFFDPRDGLKVLAVSPKVVKVSVRSAEPATSVEAVPSPAPSPSSTVLD
jgi:hypothetical protein